MIKKPNIARLIILTLLASFIGSLSYAQTFMVLEKMGTKKRYVYYVGEEIEFRRPGEKDFSNVRITQILDSAFVAHNDSIPFKSIDRINIKSKREPGIVNSAGPILIIAGLGYFAIDQINRGIVQSGGSSWDSSVATTSGIIAGTGALIMILRKNKIPMDGWWRLRKVSIY